MFFLDIFIFACQQLIVMHPDKNSYFITNIAIAELQAGKVPK